MALLDMQSVSPHLERTSIVRVINYKVNEEEKFAMYTIQITLGTYTWTVERRYRNFAAFDRKRFPDQKKSFLPPKRVIRNLDPEFLAERRDELEKYLRAVIELELWLQKKHMCNALPTPIAHFLDFHQYEVHAIVEDLSERLGACGDAWLHASTSRPKYFEFTPIELYALTERLKLAEPTDNGANSTRADLAHAIEFLHRVRNLKVRGARGYVGTSNIQWNALPFSLHFCKSLFSLWLTDCDAQMVGGLGNTKRTARRIVAHYSMKKISDLLLESNCVASVEHVEKWQCLEDVDFSFNEITDIDDSVILLGVVQKLNLSHNHLIDIGAHLQHLTRLTELDLSHNGIEIIEQWHTRLGSLKRLVLAGNSVRSLRGLRKLYALEMLDVRDNALTHVEQVWPIGDLPCLVELRMNGNPLQQIVEYRTRVLEAFGARAHEVMLDEARADRRELDTIAVRQAMHKAKREKEEQLRMRNKQITERLRFLTGDDSALLNVATSRANEDDLHLSESAPTILS